MTIFRCLLLLCGITFPVLCTGNIRLLADEQDASSSRQPNIVLIVADDLGFADLGFRGSDIRTPNLDQLARTGVVLDHFYVCPMCSPTRAGLLTGRWPLRFGMMRAVVPPWRKTGLPAAEDTLPEMLARAGYEQRAILGKWHLGHAHAGYHPLRHGFTHFLGHYNGAIDYFTKTREGELDWHRDEQPDRSPGYATDLLGTAADAFIRNCSKHRPYFLYLPFNAPHAPFQAPDELLKQYPERKGKRKALAAMITSLDSAVGQVLAAIESRGDAEDTLIWFFSDNGGVRNIADNGPLRGAKLTPYEGGIRVVACARYPRGGIQGGRKVTARMGYIDVYPTLAHFARAPQRLATAEPLDGINVANALAKGSPLPDRPWFTYEEQSKPGERLAVNTDSWKLVVQGRGVLKAVGRNTAEPQTIELFRIDRDPHETQDVSAEHPRVVQKLLEQARKFRGWQNPRVPAYHQGRAGFKAPKDWTLPPAPPQDKE